MRKSVWITLVVIAGAIFLIVSTFESSSRYVTFAEAKTLGSHVSVHVIGALAKSSAGKPLLIEESSDYLSCQFLLEDTNGEQHLVKYPYPMPTDFRRAEQVVIVGTYREAEEVFDAQKILLKCPSKYEEGKSFDAVSRS